MDRGWGVLADVVVGMGRDREPPDHAMRLILVRTTPHQKRGKASGGSRPT